MLDKWLTKYPRPFIRASPFTPTAPAPSALRSQLKDFLDRAITTSCSSDSSSKHWFEEKLARLCASLESLPAVEEVLDDDNARQDAHEPPPTEPSDEQLHAQYQDFGLLKVRRASPQATIIAQWCVCR
jgi:hypothetical protein